MLTLEKHGGICDCQASRDTFVYAASAERNGLSTVTQILGEIVLRPRITDEEVIRRSNPRLRHDLILDLTIPVERRETNGRIRIRVSGHEARAGAATDGPDTRGKFERFRRSISRLIQSSHIPQAAYRDNTLGLPKICPETNVQKIDKNILFTYLKHHYTPSRMVVAGVGIEHQALVDAVQE